MQAQTLYENFVQNINLSKILTDTRTALGYAEDTSRAVRAASGVVQFVNYPTELGNDILADSMDAFDNAFPDVKNSQNSFLEIQGNIEKTGSGGYDPSSLQEAFAYAKKTKSNVFDIKARFADKDGVSKAHDKLSQELKDERVNVDKLYEQLESEYKRNDLTPQEAAVFQARIAAEQARASIQSAANQNEMARLEKIRFDNEVESSTNANSSFNKEIDLAKDKIPDSLALDPWNYKRGKK
ncbi:MAG: hypothetical protein WCK49_05235 [Myxococcaceae bacterium]